MFDKNVSHIPPTSVDRMIHLSSLSTFRLSPFSKVHSKSSLTTSHPIFFNFQFFMILNFGVIARFASLQGPPITKVACEGSNQVHSSSTITLW